MRDLATRKAIREMTDAAGVPCSFERGRHHVKVFVDGQMLGCLSYSMKDGKGSKQPGLNVVAAVKRYLRQKGLIQ